MNSLSTTAGGSLKLGHEEGGGSSSIATRDLLTGDDWDDAGDGDGWGNEDNDLEDWGSLEDSKFVIF